VSANADTKMPKVIELWAPWMGQKEAMALIDDINRTPIWQRKPDGKVLGDRLRVTNAHREWLKLWTIAACDMSPEQAQEWRKTKDRERRRRLRQLHGAKSRPEYETQSKSTTKPWLALGMSRRTWYRYRGTSTSAGLAKGVRKSIRNGPHPSAKIGGTSVDAIKLIRAEDIPVPPELTPPPKKGRAVPLAQMEQPNTPTKAQKPKLQRRASVDATAPPAQRTNLSQVEPDTSFGATKTEQELVEMVTVLRKFLGNQATNGDWRKHMEIHSKWSKSTFDRRLRIVKARGWIRVVGNTDANLERAPWGSLLQATEIAPGVSSQFGSKRCQESATLSGAADAAAKAAMELLQRLNRDKPAA